MKNNNIGSRLRSARENVGISAADLAARIGVTEQSYRRYERSEVIPKIDLVMNVANQLGLSLDALFAETQSKATLEVTVRPGDSIVIRGADLQENDEPYAPNVRLTSSPGISGHKVKQEDNGTN
jgi:transcriptional regulator with XRE-family HTH domain